MLPALADLKRDHGLERVACVADKDLNCSANIAAAVASGDGFVFSQSLRGIRSGRGLREWATSGAGWGGPDGDGASLKSVLGTKTMHLKAEDTTSGRPEDVDVPVRYVAMYSEKYRRRARRDRERALEKARALVADPGAYTRAASQEAARWVRGVHFDRETGAVADGCRPELDTDAIREAKTLDGYYLIVTSETGWPARRVAAAYRELWRIEESFRVTKSALRARPST